MNRIALVPLLLASAVAAPPALACGESMFNTGKGLEFQAYLAPRPATVLIFGTPDPTSSDAQRAELVKGLEAAGHKVVAVADVDAYAQALRAGKVDLVIADAGAVDRLAGAQGEGAAPRLLPVLAKGTRPESTQGGRFELFLRGGARLGQYLRAIDKAVSTAGR
jgi:ABC-type phosphate/phosphonate transport system substrate-binding protein